MTTSQATPLTRQERETFWRRRGWTPELSEAERSTIEQQWTDQAIEEALAHGF